MKQVEYLIVGSGLAGIMLAFEMMDQGLQFMMISAPQKKRASDVAAGMFNPLVFKRLTLSWMADELLPVMKNRYMAIENQLGQKFLYEKNMVKPLSEQEKLLWQEKIKQASFAKYIRKITPEAPVGGLAPSPAFGIISGCGYLDTEAFLNAARRQLEERQLLQWSDVGYKDIRHTDKYAEVKGIKARSVVFCEGAYLANNPFFSFIKLVPVKGEVLQLYMPDLDEQYILNKQLFVVPVGNRRFKAGSTYDWQDKHWEPTHAGKESIISRLEAFVHSEYKVEGHVAGIRPAIHDRRPVLGAHPKYRNLWIFNGLGTKGVMLAPYFARQMLKLLTTQDYIVNLEADIRRFF